jgi:DNA-binding HxlR family transcriptional regulator
VLDALSDKWVTLVLTALARGPRRYSELARTIAGVSQKMLTQTLRSLERDGLVARTVIPTVPVTVSYELTEHGLSLHSSCATSKNGPRGTWMRCSPIANAMTRAPVRKRRGAEQAP